LTDRLSKWAEPNAGRASRQNVQIVQIVRFILSPLIADGYSRASLGDDLMFGRTFAHPVIGVSGAMIEAPYLRVNVFGGAPGQNQAKEYEDSHGGNLSPGTESSIPTDRASTSW
jgi:hypothetical protein